MIRPSRSLGVWVRSAVALASDRWEALAAIEAEVGWGREAMLLSYRLIAKSTVEEPVDGA